MRLFTYYAWHSFINQLRKLLHTWVIIFILACGLMGGLIGFGAAMLADSADSYEESGVMIEESVPEGEEWTGDPEEIPELLEEFEEGEESEPFEMPISGGAIFELVVGALVFIYLAFRVLTADKSGSSIFQPADTVLLFGSPMTPQAVLFFRLMTQLGAMLALTIYMGLQVPNMVINLGLTLGAAIAALGAWLFSLFAGTVLSTLIYLLADRYEPVRNQTQNINTVGKTAFDRNKPVCPTKIFNFQLSIFNFIKPLSPSKNA